MAVVVGSFTGVEICRSDAEFIGNAQDAFLKDYTKALKRARDADNKEMSRARRAGRAAQPARLPATKERLYSCKYGGVPRNVVPHAARQPLPVHKQPVPIRRVQPLQEVNLQLQREIKQLREESLRERETRHALNALCAAVEVERNARDKAETGRANTEAALDREHEAATARRQEWKAKLLQADRERHEAVGKALRLESMLSAAHVDVARAVQREQTARAEATASAAEVCDTKGQLEKASVAREQLDAAKQRAKEAAVECLKLRGQVARLGSQVAVAQQEVARAQERENAARKEAQQAAQQAADERVSAVATVTEQLRKARKEMRELKVEKNREAGKLALLGGKLGAALVDAARAQEYANASQLTIESLQERMSEQEADAEVKLQRVRELKANMAKRARCADQRAQESDSLRKSLDAAMEKLKLVRKELNATKVQLNLELCEEEEESDVDSISPLEGESSSAEDDSNAEDRLALSRIRSMPTWQAVRGKGQGKGQAKMEWGTRVIVYSLLAMMVPPAAVGAVIVAIVKRTAPWLSPAAPTYEAVKRCRFELRLVEEVSATASKRRMRSSPLCCAAQALAARRLASAYRIRTLGFDETTKLGQVSLTSNVQIEPSEGSKLEDVILRAAYCPLGGTAELQVQSIETKCFSRLRDFLRRWRQKFEQMYPHNVWTGPDPSRCSLHRLGGGGGLVTDTCTTARKARKLLAEAIAEQVQSHTGSEDWEAMSEEQQAAAVRTHEVDCWQHLRNIFLAEMSSAQVSILALRMHHYSARSLHACSSVLT